MSRSEVLELFARHTILPTPQRVEVAEIILARPQHLSADQIIDRLRKLGSSVSKATVYNTLHLFGEKGLVRELYVDSSRTFYDSTTHPHHHFYHIETGELSDIPANQVHVMNLPPLPAGTQQDSVEVLIKIRDKKS